MEWLALAILAISCVAGFILVFFNFFGTLIIFAGALAYAFLTDFATINGRTLAVLLFLYVLGELLDYALVVLGAKKFGASNRAVFGAFAGGLAGAVFGAAFFGIGVIPGIFLGVFSGAFIFEFIAHRDVYQSLKAGTGSLAGALGSVFAKALIGVGMIALVILRLAQHF